MVRSPVARGWRGTCFAAVLAGIGAAGFAAAPIPAPRPAARIPVEPLGFVAPARFYMPYRIPSATLDFLDPAHLLFTFHTAKLMRRETGDPPEDQDQTVRALVLSLPDGKVEAEGTWRLHDREQYLWMLGNGHFLMRQRDTLYIGDKSMFLTQWLHPEGQLVSVQLSPDTSTLVAQFAQEVKTYDAAGNRLTSAPTLGDDAPHFEQTERGYSLIVVDTQGKTATRIARMHHAVLLPMVEGGYLGLQQGSGKDWQVALIPFKGDQHVVAHVSSPCQPTVHSVSQRVFLVQSCMPYSSDHLVDAFDLEGHKLWEQVWQSRFTWGTYAYSLAGNRFAYGSIEVNHTLASLDPVDESSILGQPVGVFSLQTGKLESVLDASPILTAGDNFALSPDGDTFAILREGAIEIYKLPPSPASTPAAAGASRH